MLAKIYCSFITDSLSVLTYDAQLAGNILFLCSSFFCLFLSLVLVFVFLFLFLIVFLVTPTRLYFFFLLFFLFSVKINEVFAHSRV